MIDNINIVIYSFIFLVPGFIIKSIIDAINLDGNPSEHKSADIEHGRNGYQPSKGANHRTEFNDLPKVGSGIMPPKQGKSD